MNDWIEAEQRAERSLELSEAQEYEEALAELDAAIAIHPHDASWHEHRGRLLDELERHDEAVRAFRDALALDEDQPEIALALAVDLIRTRSFQESVEILEQVAEQHPDFEPAYCHRIAAYTRLGDHERAEEMFYLAQEIDAECPNCFHHLAESLACRASWGRALYCWNRCLEISPDYPQVRQRIGQVYRQTGELDKAREIYLEALRRDPGNLELLAELGDLMVEMNDLPAAAAKFTHLHELDPENARALVMLGLIELRGERNESALKYLEAALAVAPQHPGLRSYLGETEFRRGNLYAALGHLTVALEQDDADMVALLAMGNCLLRLERYRDAETCFKRAAALKPNTIAALHNLAVCRFLARDLAGGVEYCRRALAIEPANTLVLHKLSLALIGLGQFSEAQTHIRRGLELAPGHDGFLQLRRRFRWLKLRHFLKHLGGAISPALAEPPASALQPDSTPACT